MGLAMSRSYCKAIPTDQEIPNDFIFVTETSFCGTNINVNLGYLLYCYQHRKLGHLCTSKMLGVECCWKASPLLITLPS